MKCWNTLEGYDSKIKRERLLGKNANVVQPTVYQIQALGLCFALLCKMIVITESAAQCDFYEQQPFW